MKDDLFWRAQIHDYSKSFALFHKQFIADTGIDDIDVINEHWFHLIETVCDCEGCREESECVISMDCVDDDFIE